MFFEKIFAKSSLQNFAFVIHPGWTFVFLLILLIDFIADILICPAHATLLSSSRGGPLRGAGPPGFAAQCSAPTRLCALRGIFGRTGPFQKSNPHAQLSAVSSWAAFGCCGPSSKRLPPDKLSAQRGAVPEKPPGLSLSWPAGRSFGFGGRPKRDGSVPDFRRCAFPGL